MFDLNVGDDNDDV